MKHSGGVALPLGRGTGPLLPSPVPVAAFGPKRWWWNWKRLLRTLGLANSAPSSLELVHELQALKGTALKEQHPMGLKAQLTIGLLQGMQQLASKGRHPMERNAQAHQRLCEHLRELGLLAGSQNLPMSRLQRWMEERVLLEGLMSGTLCDLSVTLPPDGVNYLRQPLLHMALFEHLCALAWASNAGRNGRISVRFSNGELTYLLMFGVEGEKNIHDLARIIWELEKICLLSGTVRGPRIEMSMSVLEVTITASA
jgi:hypothetical protein